MICYLRRMRTDIGQALWTRRTKAICTVSGSWAEVVKLNAGSDKDCPRLSRIISRDSFELATQTGPLQNIQQRLCLRSFERTFAHYEVIPFAF